MVTFYESMEVNRSDLGAMHIRWRGTTPPTPLYNRPGASRTDPLADPLATVRELRTCGVIANRRSQFPNRVKASLHVTVATNLKFRPPRVSSFATTIFVSFFLGRVIFLVLQDVN
jgi:hypothetical protein